MCWKHEWARAINNLEWAKIHVTRAKLKTEKRGMHVATRRGEILIKTLEEAQEDLKGLIAAFGISKKEQSQSLKEHMKGKRTKRGHIQAWVRKN